MKVDVIKVVKDAVQSAVEEFFRLTTAIKKINYYKATERLLRNYKAMKQLYEHPEEYTFVPGERSKSVTIAPPSGGMFKTREEILDDTIEERLYSYNISCAQFRWFDAVIRQFEARHEFVIIRMYYFGEDVDGNEREDGQKYTFEEIAEQLTQKGVERSVKTLRSWRSQIVQDMTVRLFVVDGTLSIGNRELRETA